MNDKPQARLFLAADLAADAAVPLAAEQAHYLGSVLRLGVGASLAVFNGRDGEWLARIATLGKARGTITVERQLRAQAPEGDLWLLFAPIKRTRFDTVVEKATELGVGLLWPVLTRRTQVERVNLARIRAIAIEAAEQCERLTVPTIREPVPLDEALAQWPRERRLLACVERGPHRALAASLDGPALGVLVGPEGGFAESELDALLKLPFVSPVGLGPRVLRADTAAVAALAIVQALAGDWRRDAPPP